MHKSTILATNEPCQPNFTSDGELAVLSGGTSGTRCTVKVFDPEKGFVSSTPDLDITTPLSLGLTLDNQYVILSGTDAEQQVPAVETKMALMRIEDQSPVFVSDSRADNLAS